LKAKRLPTEITSSVGAANFAKLPELLRRDGWSFVLNDPIDGDPTLRGGTCDHVAAGQITDSVRD